MKIKDLLTIAFFILISIIWLSCEKNENPELNDENLEDNNGLSDTTTEPQINQMIIGTIDSIYYFDYNPDIEFEISHNGDGYWSNIDSIDLDMDDVMDLSFIREGFADNFVSGTTNYFEYKLHNIKDYEFVCNDYDNPDTLDLGDTLTNDLNWINKEIYRLIYSEPDYMDGNWNIWGSEKYLGFRKIENDTLMGWIRVEFISSGGIIKIKECGIQNN